MIFLCISFKELKKKHSDSSGVIRYKGNLTIEGSIKSGCKLIVDGRLIVEGDIGKNSFVCSTEGIEVEGDVGENTHLISKNKIEVKGEISDTSYISTQVEIKDSINSKEKFDGNLVIMGNVEDGVKVKASGFVYIFGDVSLNAIITSQKQVFKYNTKNIPANDFDLSYSKTVIDNNNYKFSSTRFFNHQSSQGKTSISCMTFKDFIKNYPADSKAIYHDGSLEIKDDIQSGYMIIVNGDLTVNGGINRESVVISTGKATVNGMLHRHSAIYSLTNKPSFNSQEKSSKSQCGQMQEALKIHDNTTYMTQKNTYVPVNVPGKAHLIIDGDLFVVGDVEERAKIEVTGLVYVFANVAENVEIIALKDVFINGDIGANAKITAQGKIVYRGKKDDTVILEPNSTAAISSSKTFSQKSGSNVNYVENLSGSLTLDQRSYKKEQSLKVNVIRGGLKL